MSVMLTSGMRGLGQASGGATPIGDSGRRGIAVGFALLALAASASWSGCAERCRRVASLDFDATAVAPYPSRIPSGVEGFVVVGDTQRTSYQECLIGREVNDAATARLLVEVADVEPAFVLFVGDLVFHGARERHWAYFDYLARPLRAVDLPVLPVAGNHDYWGDDDAARANLRARFPHFAEDTWYVEQYAGVALVVLDSNSDTLGGAAWRRQAQWYRETMAALAVDDTVRGVMVFTHHPPYTNSPIVEGDRAVRRDFVPTFCEHGKTLAFVSGHAHGYERFRRGLDEGCGDRARQFIVTAGGGGPRPDELNDDLDDQYDGPAPRPFHYVWIESHDVGVRVEAWAVEGRDPRWLFDEVDLPWAD